jgi:hypothetical protein
MKVYIKRLGVDMQVKTRAVELGVYSEDGPGKTRPTHGGISMSWTEFIKDIQDYGNK